MELIKTPGEFLGKMDEFKIQSTLIGNGICLSHLLRDMDSNRKTIRAKIDKYRDQNIKARFVLMPISSNVIWEYAKET